MGRKKKSSFDYESDLNKLIKECNDENLDVETLKEAYNTNRSCELFLKRNEPSHVSYRQNEQLHQSTLDLAKKYKKISNIKSTIQKKRREEVEALQSSHHQEQEQIIFNHDNVTVHPFIEIPNDDCSATTAHPINEDINAPDNEIDITQVLPQTFLILY